MKTCFNCGVERPLSDFYKHSGMADGHLNKCKECVKSDVRTNRANNLEYYRAYDRGRGYHGDGIEKQSPAKRKAQRKVNNGIRDGKIERVTQCEDCGATSTIHAHHDDYAKPLDVRWLCVPCHVEWHKHHGEGANAF